MAKVDYTIKENKIKYLVGKINSEFTLEDLQEDKTVIKWDLKEGEFDILFAEATIEANKENDLDKPAKLFIKHKEALKSFLELHPHITHLHVGVSGNYYTAITGTEKTVRYTREELLNY